MLEQRRLEIRQRQLALRLRSAELRSELSVQLVDITAPVRRLAPAWRLLSAVRQSAPWARGVAMVAVGALGVLALRHPLRALAWMVRLRTGLAWWGRVQAWRAQAAEPQEPPKT